MRTCRRTMRTLPYLVVIGMIARLILWESTAFVLTTDTANAPTSMERKTEATYVSGREATARLYTSEGQKWSSVFSLNPARLAVLTFDAQRLIHDAQNPRDCSATRFVVFNKRPSGIGSSLHVSGFHAGLAWKEGRVFLWGSLGDKYTSPDTCGDVKSWLCHFREPSNCSVEDAYRRQDTIYVEDPGSPLRPKGISQQENIRAYIPDVFLDLLDRSSISMKNAELRYWWRAQTAAYFGRLNDAAVAHIAILRRAPGAMRLVGDAGAVARSRGLLSDIPFADGVISAHIRHGDKAGEMTLVPFPSYVNRSEDFLIKGAPLFLRRQLFISTEDPLVIEQAADGPGVMLGSWAASYYDLPRSNDGAIVQFKKLSDTMTAGQLTRRHLLQLLMALECDAWVGTRGSNWNRLIDELRCVWVDKCSQPYIEANDVPVSYNW